MIEEAFTVGILPQQMYDMELWEFNACIRAYNRKAQQDGKRELLGAWQTAAFTGAAFGGKLKKFGNYMRDEETTVSGQALTPEQMREFDEKLKAKGGGNDVA